MFCVRDCLYKTKNTRYVIYTKGMYMDNINLHEHPLNTRSIADASKTIAPNVPQ